MNTEADYAMLANEANFRWGANVTAHDVRDVLEGASRLWLEPFEVKAIRREAQENGIY